jgi:hypothetical protein
MVGNLLRVGVTDLAMALTRRLKGVRRRRGLDVARTEDVLVLVPVRVLVLVL